MLVNLKSILSKAKKQNKAVPAFNVYNLETIMAVLEAARKYNSPVILSFGESYFNYAPIEAIAAIVKTLVTNEDIDVVLLLDHAKKLESIIKAIQSGFTSVMYDGSGLPFEKNAVNTARIVEIAHAVGVSVEAELGYMNPEDGSERLLKNESVLYTDPATASKFIAATNIDALAIAIGNAHGIYKREPQLDMVRLKQIRDSTDIPLALHGCSGIPVSLLKETIASGICKINVNTEITIGGVKAIKELFENNPNQQFRLENVLQHSQNKMEQIIESFISLTNYE